MFGSKEKEKIKKAEKQEKIAAIAALLGRMGGGLQAAGGISPKLGEGMAEMAGNIAAGAAEEKAAAQEKLEKRAGMFSTFGNILGGPLLGSAAYKVGGGEDPFLERYVGNQLQGLQMAAPMLLGGMGGRTSALAPGVQEGFGPVPGGVPAAGPIPDAAAGPVGRFAGENPPPAAAPAAGIPGAVPPKPTFGDRLRRTLMGGFGGGYFGSGYPGGYGGYGGYGGDGSDYYGYSAMYDRDKATGQPRRRY